MALQDYSNTSVVVCVKERVTFQTRSIGVSLVPAANKQKTRNTWQVIVFSKLLSNHFRGYIIKDVIYVVYQDSRIQVIVLIHLSIHPDL